MTTTTRDLVARALEQSWRQVPAEACLLAQSLTKLAQDVQQAISGLPLANVDVIWYAPETKTAMVLMRDGASPAALIHPLLQVIPRVYLSKQASFPADELWVPLARGTNLPDQEKVASMYAAVHELMGEWGMFGGYDSHSDATNGIAKAAYSPTLRVCR